MNYLARRAFARYSKALVFAAAALLPPFARAVDEILLTLAAATDLAVQQQPVIDAQRQAARAAHESAVAAGQLPDPVLVGGLTDLTITGPERYTLRTETDTQFMLGIRQTFPGGDKRALRKERGEAQAVVADATVQEQQRMVRRETALAWLDAWKALQARSLVAASLVEAQRQADAVEISYRTGRASQADLLSARVSAGLLEDQQAGLAQQEWHARNQLRRWIGAAAEQPLADQFPARTPPDAAELLKHVGQHPHVAVQQGEIAAARADLALAKADYHADWSLQASYGYRPEFADYASLQFELGLPYFTRNRQARGVEAKAADVARNEALLDDALRQSRAEIELNLDDWRRLQERLKRYDESILPQAQRRLDAALASYASGGASLLSVLDARRSLLEIRMQRLDLQLDTARHETELRYFAYDESQS